MMLLMPSSWLAAFLLLLPLTQSSFWIKLPVVQGFSIIAATTRSKRRIQTWIESASKDEENHCSNDDDEEVHHVENMPYRPLTLEIKGLGPITILQATAKSQSILVDMTASEEDEEENKASTTTTPRTLLKQNDPFGFVLWPAALPVINYILNNNNTRTTTTDNMSSALKGLNVLELGTGTGLVSLAAALAGARRVCATDFEPLALQILQYTIQTLNPKHLQHLQQVIDTKLIDVCQPFTTSFSFDDNDNNNKQQQDDPNNDNNNNFDLILAADVLYETHTGHGLAHFIHQAMMQYKNCRIVVGDGPGRPGRAVFLRQLRTLLNDDTIDFSDCSQPHQYNDHAVFPKRQLPVAILDLHSKHYHK